jgi:hypothetical protein
MGMFTDPYNDFGRLTPSCGVRCDWCWTRACTPRAGPRKKPCLGDGELGASAKLDQERGAPLPAVAGTGDHLQDRHDQDPAAARREAQKELGDKFDIKAFHDTVVTGGSMPLPVLEQRVRAWIATQKKS